MLQDLNADSVKVHYACCVYLVLKAEADGGKPAVEGASIGTLLKGLDINVFLFFRIVTQMFQSAGRDAWFRNIFGGDCAKSEKDFRQLEAHFIILVILFAKYRKVSWTHPTAPSSPPHKGARTWTDGRTDTHTPTHARTHALTHFRDSDTSLWPVAAYNPFFTFTTLRCTPTCAASQRVRSKRLSREGVPRCTGVSLRRAGR
jgi:hypothetical protein